ncbi:hypothetical protein [Streptomyces sp. PTY087I2]|uniref:hypothetical protein n=1 Tax=Streptomyces sp. PTY087I2 TaxID=1819298 RepID=UPI00159ED613|nr:hypothetical protein [Streptomyces sp. PTY087I2]
MNALCRLLGLQIQNSYQQRNFAPWCAGPRLEYFEVSSRIDLAIKEAAKSLCRHKVGAVLIKGSRVLAMSSNRYRNSPGVDFMNATFHAEEVVLRRFTPARGATIYVARVNRIGETALARPCERCQAALLERGVRRACYTTSTGFEVLKLTSF